MTEEKSIIIKQIKFSSDGFVLQGYLHLPTTKRPPVVIGSHGLLSSSSSPKQIALADRCNRLGVAYFRFDHRGCGQSQGEFEEVTSLEARCKDLTQAVNVMKDKTDTSDHFGLFGSSMGGTVCLSVAGKLGANALITFAAPICSHLPEKRPGLASHPKEQGIYFDVAKHSFDITDKLSEIRNILIFHGDADDIVPVSHAGEIFKLAQEPKKLIVQKHGDHPMSNKKHQKVFIKEASLWFKQSLNNFSAHEQ